MFTSGEQYQNLSELNIPGNSSVNVFVYNFLKTGQTAECNPTIRASSEEISVQRYDNPLLFLESFYSFLAKIHQSVMKTNIDFGEQYADYSGVDNSTLTLSKAGRIFTSQPRVSIWIDHCCPGFSIFLVKYMHAVHLKLSSFQMLLCEEFNPIVLQALSITIVILIWPGEDSNKSSLDHQMATEIPCLISNSLSVVSAAFGPNGELLGVVGIDFFQKKVDQQFPNIRFQDIVIAARNHPTFKFDPNALTTTVCFNHVSWQTLFLSKFYMPLWKELQYEYLSMIQFNLCPSD